MRRTLRGALGTSTVALVILTGSAAEAQPRATAILDLRVDPSAADCPSPDDLRTQIAARLGYNPVDPAATQTVIGTLRLDRGRLVATVSLKNADGSVRERTPLVSDTKDCREIAASFVLAISIAIDPMSMVRPTPSSTPLESPPPPPPPASVPPSAAVPEEPKAEPALEPRARLELRGGAGILASVGMLPHPSVAPTVFGGASLGRAALHLEARYDLPATADGPNDSHVTGSLFLGTLAPCFEPLPAFFCGIGSIGAFFGEGTGVLVPRSDQTLYAALGLRAGLEARLADRIRGRIQVEGLVPLIETSLSVVGNRVWSSPAAVGSLGAVILFR